MHIKIYILLVHDNLMQVERLIKKLDDGSSRFYIHLDKKYALTNEMAELHKNKHVFFVKQRTSCCWGDFSIVSATLSAMREALDARHMGHLVLLSGQDYPIESNVSLSVFLKERRLINFIDCHPIEAVWPTKYIFRIQAHKINFSEEKGDYVVIPTIYTLRIRRILVNFLKIIKKAKREKSLCYLSLIKKFFIKKTQPKNIKFYGGSQWWAINTETAKKILQYVDEHPGFLNFFSDSLIPDELFFQTIIMALKKKGEDIILHDNLTYTHWENENISSPKILDITDIDKISNARKNGKFFARKFDAKTQSDILDWLDNLTI